MSEEKKESVGLEEFSEVEMKDEGEQRRREWERMKAVKCYRIGEIDGGGFFYENQRGNERIIVKAFERYAYVVWEKVKE